MGITIDKAVDRLEDLHFEQDNWEYEELTEDCLLNREALRLAIDTMRKYQKIAELYDYWRSGKCEYTISCMENIGKVLRDGKND